MIGRIHGKIIEKKPPLLLVDVHGVGYEILAPMTTFYGLSPDQQEVTLHTHFVVREDAQQLFGFLQDRDRSMFRALIKISGVGPKLALTILSGIETQALVQAVLLGDTSLLTQVPGIGKKTAERLILEMRPLIEKWSDELTSTQAIETNSNPTSRDAIDALVALGYKENDAKKAINKVGANAKTTESLIKAALQLLH